MNGHSVLLRHVGGWRGPPGHKAGPTARGFLASQACSVLLICSLLSSGFWHFRPEHHQAALGAHPDRGPWGSVGHVTVSHVHAQRHLQGPFRDLGPLLYL